MTRLNQLALLASALCLSTLVAANTMGSNKIYLGQKFAQPQKTAEFSLAPFLAGVNYEVSCYLRGSEALEPLLVKPNVFCYSIDNEPRCTTDAFKIPVPQGSVMFTTKVNKDSTPVLTFLNLDTSDQLIAVCYAEPAAH